MPPSLGPFTRLYASGQAERSLVSSPRASEISSRRVTLRVPGRLAKLKPAALANKSYVTTRRPASPRLTLF